MSEDSEEYVRWLCSARAPCYHALGVHTVALSSWEAGFAGVIRGAGQGLGHQALLRDVGVETSLRVWTDSSAAVGICNRHGLGKLRHLDTRTLWIQQAVRLGRVDLQPC